MPANKRNLILAASAVLVLLSALVTYAVTAGDTPMNMARHWAAGDDLNEKAYNEAVRLAGWPEDDE